MGQGKFLLVAAAVGAMLVLAGPASAEDCAPLKLVSRIDLVSDGGIELVPVDIGGVSKLMVLAIGSSQTILQGSSAEALGLPTRPIEPERIGPSGLVADRVAVTAFGLGRIKSGNLRMLVTSKRVAISSDPRIVGILGADILSQFDVSVDFGAHRLDLLDQRHCEGSVVYWPERPIAVIPYEPNSDNLVVVPVTIDSHAIRAWLDSGTTATVLTVDSAERDLGLTFDADARPRWESKDSRRAFKYAMHRFGSLALAGITVSNPEIMIVPGEPGDDQPPGPPLELGMDVLKHLHIYIAYRERKLYVTPASAAPANTGAPP